MTGTNQNTSKHRHVATRTERLLGAAKHPFRTRGRVIGVTAGAAAAIVLGTGLAATTQPSVGEALGLPTPAPTAVSTVNDASIVRAQAAATIATAQGVAQTANGATDTAELDRDIKELSSYRTMSTARIQQQIVDTVVSTNDVSAQSADDTKAQADKRAAARVAATRAAAAKAAAARAAAEQAAAKAAAAQAAAARLAASNTPSAARATASSMAASRYGWGSDQFACLDSLWTKESGWNYKAYNPSGAFGIPQALPGSKMATVGSDWQDSASTQIAWGLEYISAAYGTPCAAWAHSEATNFY